MATPEAIHGIGCAKDISKSSRDRRKLGPDSTGNSVARKQALSSCSNVLAIDTGDQKGAGEVEGWQKTSFFSSQQGKT